MITERAERSGLLVPPGENSNSNNGESMREREKDRIRAALFARNSSAFMTLLGEAATTNDYKRVRDFYYRNYDKINLPKARLLSRIDFSHNPKLREFLVEMGMTLDGDNLSLDSPLVCALNATPIPDMEAVDYFASLGCDVVACDAHVLESVVKKCRPEVRPVFKLTGYGVPSNYIPCPALKCTYSGENALFDYALDNDHYELARILKPDYDEQQGRRRQELDQQEYLQQKDPCGCRSLCNLICCCFNVQSNDSSATGSGGRGNTSGLCASCLLGRNQHQFLFHSVPPSSHTASGVGGAGGDWYCCWCGCGVCCFGPGGLRRYCQHFSVLDTKYLSVACSRGCLAGCLACMYTPILFVAETCDRRCLSYPCCPSRCRCTRCIDECWHLCYPRYSVQEPFRGEPVYVYEESSYCGRLCARAPCWGSS